MIAGRRAFARGTAPQTMTAILEQDPDPLSRSGQQIPRELDRIVARCLDKNPRERTQSARDLSVALRDLANPAGPPHVLTTSQPGRRTVAWAGAALFIVVAVASAALRWFNPPAQSADSIAVLPFVNGSGNADLEYLSDGITESLINALSRVPSLVVMSRTSVFQIQRTRQRRAGGRPGA